MADAPGDQLVARGVVSPVLYPSDAPCIGYAVAVVPLPAHEAGEAEEAEKSPVVEPVIIVDVLHGRRLVLSVHGNGHGGESGEQAQRPDRAKVRWAGHESAPDE
jgi:hypothetical protein